MMARQTISSYLLIFSILLLHECQLITSLHLTLVQIPEYVDVRDVVTLKCSWQMSENKLNSVKWYKDSQEFFRYAPLMDKQISNWTVDGVNFYKENPYNCNKQTCSVSLDNLSTRSTGVYRCEISADAPSFSITYSDQRMTVIALPRHDPLIQGLKSHYYNMGDTVQANCTSDMSYPAANLTWYINDEKINSDRAIFKLYETTIDNEGLTLRYRTMEICFRLDEANFGDVRGKLFLKCIAYIEKIPNTKRQTSDLIYIQSDDLNNLRLINSRNFATATIKINVISAIFLLLSLL